MDQRTEKKRPKRERPKFKIPLDDEWSLIFLSSGRRFVYNSKEKRSTWEPPKHIEEIIEGIDKKQLILLIAKARGLRLGNESNKNEQEVMDEMRDEAIEAVETDKSVESDHSLNEEPEEEDQNVESDTSEEKFTADIQSIDVSDDEELNEDEKKHQFFQLLEEYDVNPYGIWESELNKIIEDDRYDLYDAGNQRLEAFNSWSKEKIKQSKEQTNDQLDSSNIDPIISFLLFIKTNYNSKLFYIDFKRKFRKNSAFSDIDLLDKDKEKLYREYSVLMKKPEHIRIELLKEKSLSVKEIELEPVYYTIENPSEILTENRKDSEISSKQTKLLQRQQTVDAERRKLDAQIHRSKNKLRYKTQDLAKATYEIDSLSSLKDILNGDGN